MGIEISKLPEAEALDMEEEVVVVQNGVTKKAKARNMLTNTDKDISQINKNIEKINKTLDTQNTDIKNINTSISNIKKEQITQNENIDQSKKEIEHLKKYINVLPYAEAEGKIVSINDSANVPVLAVGVSGYSEQATRSGKNILKPIEFNHTNAEALEMHVTAKNGIYGITGSVPIRSAGSLAWRLTTSYKMVNYVRYIENQDVDLFIPAGTYTISVKFLGGTINNTDDRIHFDYRLDNNAGKEGNQTFEIGQIKKSTQVNAVISKTFTVEEETPFSVFAQILNTRENSSYTNVQWEMQLEKGEVATDFEKYGAMPSPDFSSEIRNLGDDINLFDEKWDNTSTTSTSKNFIPVVAGEEYIFSLNGKGTAVWYYFYENIENSEFNKIYKNSNQVFIPEKNGFIKLERVLTSDKCKLQKGSIITPYSPYGYGTVEITHCNANLYNYKDIYSKSDGVTIDNEGWITITGDNTGGESSMYKNYFTNKMNLKTSTQYAILVEIKSFTGKGTITTNSEPDQFNDIFTHYNFSELKNGDIKKIVRTTRNDFTSNIGLRSFVTFGKGESGSITFRISILEDTTITPEAFKYVPHQSETTVFPTKPLHENDYLADDGIHRKRETIIYTGKETWSKRGTQEHTFARTLPKISLKGLCSHYKSLGANSNINKKDGYYLATSATVIITDMRFSTVEEFKAYLLEEYEKGTPVTVEYEFAEEKIEPYTPEQQEAWDKLQKLMMYDVTHFISDANLKIKYVKDINKEHQQLQSQIDEIKALLSPTATSAMLLDNLENDLMKEV